MAPIRCPRPLPPFAFPLSLLLTPPPGPAPPPPPPSGLDRGWYVPHVSWVLVWPATRVPCGQTLPGVRANYQRSGAGASVRACVCEKASAVGGGGPTASHFQHCAEEGETGDAQIPPKISQSYRPTDFRTEPQKSKQRKRTAVEHGRRNSSFARETVTGTQRFYRVRCTHPCEYLPGLQFDFFVSFLKSGMERVRAEPFPNGCLMLISVLQTGLFFFVYVQTQKEHEAR